MSADAWSDLNLLRVPERGTSVLKRARSILRDIVTTSTVNSTPTLWRGQASIDHRICPTIAHDLSDRATRAERVLDRTERTLQNAEQGSRRWREGPMFATLGPLARLAHLRHHGIPSPLLDVTPDPFIALWFATAAGQGRSDGILVGFNKTKSYVDLSIGSNFLRAGEVIDGGDARSDPEEPPFTALLSQLGNKIGVIDPPVVNDRVVVQRSRFLLSAFPSGNVWHQDISDIWLPPMPSRWRQSSIDGLFDHERSQGRPFEVPLVGILIPYNVKEKLRSLLNSHFGVDQTTVFPDTDGLPSDAASYDDKNP